MYKVTVIGHFGEGLNSSDGQTIKTKILTEAMENHFGAERVCRVDTHGGLKTLLKAPSMVKKAFLSSENVMILPAQNGLRVFVPLCAFWKRKYPQVKLHYSVIGGWLPQFVSERNCLAELLKKFDAIYVETQTMKNALEAQGFANVLVMPNCKKLTVLSEDELVYPSGIPYRLCTFSRVMKEKGVETVTGVINQVNNKLGYTAYSLDIYGQVDSLQIKWFETLKKHFPDYVRYCGCVDADKSVEVLQQYFALIFPTHFYTEGIPGTIIDAYAAGIPVISARWESFADVVDDGITGVGYDFDNVEQLEEVLLSVAQNPKKLLDMKENCIRKAKNYMPESTLQIITSKIRGGGGGIISIL